MKKKFMFHITNIKNIEDINENGLKAGEDGYTYLFEGVNVYVPYLQTMFPIDQLIANNQCFLQMYAMFVVDVTGLKLEKDNVAELTARWQRRYNGDIPKDRIVDFSIRSSAEYVNAMYNLIK